MSTIFDRADKLLQMDWTRFGLKDVETDRSAKEDQGKVGATGGKAGTEGTTESKAPPPAVSADELHPDTFEGQTSGTDAGKSVAGDPSAPVGQVTTPPGLYHVPPPSGEELEQVRTDFNLLFTSDNIYEVASMLLDADETKEGRDKIDDALKDVRLGGATREAMKEIMQEMMELLKPMVGQADDRCPFAAQMQAEQAMQNDAKVQELALMLQSLFGISATEVRDLLSEMFRGGTDGLAVALLIATSVAMLAVGEVAEGKEMLQKAAANADRGLDFDMRNDDDTRLLTQVLQQSLEDFAEKHPEIAMIIAVLLVDAAKELASSEAGMQVSGFDKAMLLQAMDKVADETKDAAAEEIKERQEEEAKRRQEEGPKVEAAENADGSSAGTLDLSGAEDAVNGEEPVDTDLDSTAPTEQDRQKGDEANKPK